MRSTKIYLQPVQAVPSPSVSPSPEPLCIIDIKDGVFAGSENWIPTTSEVDPVCTSIASQVLKLSLN